DNQNHIAVQEHKPFIDKKVNDDSELSEDDLGKYYIVNYTEEIEERTYIKGFLHGKYRGFYEDEETKCKYYSFDIYESQIDFVEKINYPFLFEINKEFPRDKLPPVITA